MIRFGILLLAFMWAGDVAAQGLSFPSNAKMTRNVGPQLDDFTMPTGPWADGAVPSVTQEGQFSRQAWTVEATGLSTLQLIRPLRDQLRNDGFDVVFECKDEDCGGFDFRFAMPVLPPPEMQVNLADFRYLAARKDSEDGPVLLSLLASRSARAGFVQVSSVGPTSSPVTTRTDAAPVRGAVVLAQTNDMAKELTTIGRSVLTGLEFGTGSSQLGQGPFASLDTLADILEGRPDLKIALVGHTDSSGSLNGNIALSKRRAGSVLERLVSDYNVPRAQLDAQGMGYLSPISTNLTAEGRTANRRVEVIVVSTD